MKKHFNLGNVWGRVGGTKAEESTEGKPYLSIQVECPNDLFGNIKTYGRLWGKEKIDAFMDHYKKNPGTAYRFRGFFSQYDKEEGLRLSNYTFYSWDVFNGAEFRASFVLVGLVAAIEEKKEEGMICLSLSREGAAEEEFVVYTLTLQDLAGISEGDVIEVKGVLRYKEPEDFFGASSHGTVKPYVMESRK